MKFIGGMIFALILIAVVGAVVVYGGFVNMAASREPNKMEEWIGNTLYVKSMQKRAPQEKNPVPVDSTALAEGREHYAKMCVICHAAPGIEMPEIGKGLNPPAPVLDIPDVQQMSDGQLYWTIKHGIRMTGMPAFGETHSDNEIWNMVAFVRHLPQLSAEEKEQLEKAAAETEHGHDEKKEKPGRPHQHDKGSEHQHTQTQQSPHKH